MGKRVFLTLLIFVWGIFPFACDFCGTGGGSCPCDMPKVYNFRVLSMQANLYDKSFNPIDSTDWYTSDSLRINFSFDETETVYASNYSSLGQNLYACSPAEPQPVNGIVRFTLETNTILVINRDSLPAKSSLIDYFYFGQSRALSRSYSETFDMTNGEILNPRLNAFWSKELTDSVTLDFNAHFYFSDSTYATVENIRFNLKP